MSGVRGQLNLLVAATTSLVLIAFLVPLGLLLRRSAEDRAVTTATIEAQSAARLVALKQTPSDQDVTVFYHDGRQAGTPAERTESIDLAARGWAFTANSGDGFEVLIPVQGLPEGTAVVRAYVASPQTGVTQTWVVLALLGLVLFALGILIADRLGKRLVSSVTALAGTADRLAAGDLDARVEPAETPELHRVGLELNRLACRIQELLAEQREEAADLAHRLRTPMTALRLEIDSMADDDAQRRRLLAGLDALHRLVDEVIRTARRPERDGAGAAADLVAVCAERVAFWSALAQDAGRPVDRRLPTGQIRVRASEADLAAALDALLENVFAHTPDGTPMCVEVSRLNDGGGRVVISDGGPGLNAVAAGRGVSAVGSTGLGMDIARRTAESAGGAMRTGTSVLGGAAVELTFRPATG